MGNRRGIAEGHIGGHLGDKWEMGGKGTWPLVLRDARASPSVGRCHDIDVLASARAADRPEARRAGAGECCGSSWKHASCSQVSWQARATEIRRSARVGRVTKQPCHDGSSRQRTLRADMSRNTPERGTVVSDVRSRSMSLCDKPSPRRGDTRSARVGPSACPLPRSG